MSNTSIVNTNMAAILPANRKAVSFSNLDRRHREAFATPSGFARNYLGMALTDKQCAILQDMAPNGSSTSVICCNEAGKTTKLICAFVLWHLTVFCRRGENGGVISTSGSWSQIENQLVPSLKSYAPKFPRSWAFNDRSIDIRGIPNYMPFSTTDVGRAEGFHGHPEHPLAALVDEAKSVRDGIFRAIEDRCRPQRTGLFSSPGYSVGRFFESHTSAARFYTRHKLTVDDCPWIDRDVMKRLILKAGDGDWEKGMRDPVILSAYFAIFMPFVEGGLLTMADIEECLAEPPGRMHGPLHVFLDFARGGDENAIGVRNGNRVWLQDAWRERDTMSAVGRFVTNFKELQDKIGLRACEIEGDGDGNGGPMLDAIRQAGWNILEFRGGFPAYDPHRFKNQISERWFTGAELIKGRKIILPDDAEMKAQMLDRIAKFESSGRRWIESKEDLFNRQSKEQRPKRSPDRADAIFGALGDLPIVEGKPMMGAPEPQNPWSDDPDYGAEHDQHMGVPEDMLRGFDAG